MSVRDCLVTNHNQGFQITIDVFYGYSVTFIVQDNFLHHGGNDLDVLDVFFLLENYS